MPDVEIDNSGKFKYIQIRVETSTGDDTKVIIRGNQDAAYHADIYDLVDPSISGLGLKAFPTGGGRIIHEPENKYLKVFGYSMGYGKADHALTRSILQKKYPDYKIDISDEGY